MLGKKCALVAMIARPKRVKSGFPGAKDMVPWKAYRGKPDLLRKWHYAKCVYIVAIFDVVEAHILWQRVHMNVLSWQQAVRDFFLLYAYVLLGVSGMEAKEMCFLYICVRYVYIQTTVHNVHRAVLCNVHEVTKRKKREGCLYIV